MWCGGQKESTLSTVLHDLQWVGRLHLEFPRNPTRPRISDAAAKNRRVLVPWIALIGNYEGRSTWRTRICASHPPSPAVIACCAVTASILLREQDRVRRAVGKRG